MNSSDKLLLAGFACAILGFGGAIAIFMVEEWKARRDAQRYKHQMKRGW